MSLCVVCGLNLMGDVALCVHHTCVYGRDWAEANRAMCDFLHRGIMRPGAPPDRKPVPIRRDCYGSYDGYA